MNTYVHTLHSCEDILPGTSGNDVTSASVVLYMPMHHVTGSSWGTSPSRTPAATLPVKQAPLPLPPRSLMNNLHIMPGADESDHEIGPDVSNTCLLPEAELDDINLVRAFHLVGPYCSVVHPIQTPCGDWLTNVSKSAPMFLTNC